MLAKLHQLYDAVDSWVTPKFVYGFMSAVLILTLLLVTQYGFYFYWLSGTGMTILVSFGQEIHWITAVWLGLIFLWFYHNVTAKGQGIKRIFTAFMLLGFFFAVFDLYWIIKWQIQGAFLYGIPQLVFPTFKDLAVGYGRCLIIFAVSLQFARKHFHWSKAFALLLGLQFFYWIIVMSPALVMLLNGSWSVEALDNMRVFWDITQTPDGLNQYLYAPPLIQLANSLPFIYAVKRGKKD